MSGMRLPSFFKSKNPKQFEFTPRYYNQTKEAMDERRARIKNELNKGTDLGNYDSSKLRGSLRKEWQSNKNTSTFSKSSNFRVFIILFLLLALAYYILK